MAIPVAQLGYMPNLNLPTRLPDKVENPSIWEQALASLVVNAAGQAGGQLVGNVLSRDYTEAAQAMGTEGLEEAPGFWRRVVGGPQVSRDDLTRLRAEDASNQRFAVETGQREADRMSQEDRFLKQLGMTREEMAAAADRFNSELALKSAQQAFGQEMDLRGGARADRLADTTIASQTARDAREATSAPLQDDLMRSQIGQNEATTRRIDTQSNAEAAEAERIRRLLSGFTSGALADSAVVAPEGPSPIATVLNTALNPFRQDATNPLKWIGDALGTVAGSGMNLLDQATGYTPETAVREAQSFKPAAEVVAAREAANNNRPAAVVPPVQTDPQLAARQVVANLLGYEPSDEEFAMMIQQLQGQR